MRNRIIVRLLLVAIIVWLVAWIAGNTYWDEITVPTPPKKEAARNPFYAAQRFVENLGVTSTWDRFQVQVPTNAVIVVSSWHWDLAEGRRSRMEQWVEAGGRLVLDRTLSGGQEAFERWSGISRRPAKGEADEEQDEESDEDTALELARTRKFRDCRVLHEAMRAPGSRGGAAQDFELCGQEDYSTLTTTRPIAWALHDDVGTQVLRVNVGKGSVTVINSMPFQFTQFLQGDHPALLLAAARLRRGDDVHFLSEEEHASLLTLMWLFGWPVVLLSLALIALALWRNGVRFGPLTAEPDRARRSLAEQIRGTGQFAMRFGGGKSLHAAAVRALNEAAQRRVGAYARLSANERVEAVARLTGIEATVLGPAIHHSGPRRSHELRQAIALIESARRRILIGKNMIQKGSIHGN